MLRAFCWGTLVLLCELEMGEGAKARTAPGGESQRGIEIDCLTDCRLTAIHTYEFTYTHTYTKIYIHCMRLSFSVFT